MDYVHVKNLEKHHPGYKDRELKWAKIQFDIIQGDPEFELIENEIDKWRFVSMILLELQAQKPLPISDEYFKRKGFDVKKRPISLTIQMLHNFLDVVTQEKKLCALDKIREEEDIDKNKRGVSTSPDDLLKAFHEICVSFPRVRELSNTRLVKCRARLQERPLDQWREVFKRVQQSEFLKGGNDRSWKASFDWIIDNDNNAVKVLEGKYDNRNGKSVDVSKFFEQSV